MSRVGDTKVVYLAQTDGSDPQWWCFDTYGEAARYAHDGRKVWTTTADLRCLEGGRGHLFWAIDRSGARLL